MYVFPAIGLEHNGPEAMSDRAAQPMPDAQVRRMLKARLPQDFGQRRPLRLGWLLLAMVAMALHLETAHAVFSGTISGWSMLPTFLFAAFTWPYFFFVLHELGHGALLRPGIGRDIASALAAYPILLQPAFWTAAHNHHHQFANQDGDHDRRRIAGRGELAERLYEFRLANPWIFLSLFGAMYTVFYGQLISFLKGDIAFPVNRQRVLRELAIGALWVAGAGWLLGWQLLMLGWLPCALAGSALLSLYLISNHLTRPMTPEADSLGTGLSVQLFGGWSHMDFGRHVEHHLFPHVPANALKAVTVLLRDCHPTDFREASLFGTLRRLFQLPGYYLTPTVLTDRDGMTRIPID
jgi:fatty acid desaturase